VTVNNFCVSVFSNWPRCTGCHAGYGWKDANFDFTDQSRIDCLVCHDTTGTYRKDLRAAGMPDPSVDLVMVAKKVGKPSRKSCGTCHFSGGDQDFVRHGKLNAWVFSAMIATRQETTKLPAAVLPCPWPKVADPVTAATQMRHIRKIRY
jgi:hypothetical protein